MPPWNPGDSVGDGFDHRGGSDGAVERFDGYERYVQVVVVDYAVVGNAVDQDARLQWLVEHASPDRAANAAEFGRYDACSVVPGNLDVVYANGQRISRLCTVHVDGSGAGIDVRHLNDIP